MCLAFVLCTESAKLMSADAKDARSYMALLSHQTCKRRGTVVH